MKSKYITCYRKKDDKVTIYISDGAKYTGIIEKRYISFPGLYNDFLFHIFDINKWKLAEKLPYEYFDGDWHECDSVKGIIALLNALIKETKIRYYAKTEI